MKRLESYIQRSLPGDDSRLMEEMAMLAEKRDIAEELTRLQSQTSQFCRSMESDGAIGRRLDFIIQEKRREVNTVGSKSTDTWISGLVVDLKSEIEKIKERVQNIE